MANETLDIDVAINVDKAKAGADKAKEAIDAIEESAGKGEKSLAHLNKGFGEMQEIGGKMKVMVTAPLVALGTEAVKSAINFGTGMAKISTQFGNTKVSTKTLEDSIKSISKEFGIGTSVIQDGYYEALAAGIPVSEDMGEATAFITSNAKLAKAGFTSLDTAVDATTSVLNSYGLGADKVNDISNILIKTQNYGKTTVDELGKTIAQVTPEASALGVGFGQVGASISTMTAQGIKTPEVMTKLKRLFIELRDTTSGAGKAFNDISGQSFRDFVAGGGDVQQAMQMMSNHAVENGLELGNMFSSAEAGSAALVLTSEKGAELFRESYEDMQGGVDTLSSSFDKMNSTDQANLQRTLETLKIAMIDLGVSLMPTVEKIVAGVEAMVGKWNDLSPGVQDAIINFGLFAAVAGPIIGIVGTIGGAVTGLAGVFGTAGAAAGAAGVATAGAGVATVGMGAALGAAALAALPWVAGAAVVAGGVWAVHKATEQTETSVSLLDTQMKITTTTTEGYGDQAATTSGDVKDAFVNMGESAGDSVITQEEALDRQKSNLKDYGDVYEGLVETVGYVDAQTGAYIEKTTIKISEETEKMADEFLDLRVDVEKETTEMWAGQQAVTEEGVQSINNKVSVMTDKTVESYQKQKDRSLESLKILKNSGLGITDEQYEAMIDKSNTHFDESADSARVGQKRIAEILATAKNENREIKDSEYAEISTLQAQGNDHYVKAVAENGVEISALLEKLASRKGDINQEMLENTVQSMNQTRDDSITAAEATRDGIVKELLYQKDVSKTISEETYRESVDKANEARDETVASFEDIRTKGLVKLGDAYGDTMSKIGTETGKAKSYAENFSTWWENWLPKPKMAKVSFESAGAPSEAPTPNTAYATGTTYAPGGWSAINERGFEMVDLPTGAKVLPHAATKHMIERQAKETANSANQGASEIKVVNQFEVTGNMQKFIKVIRREL